MGLIRGLVKRAGKAMGVDVRDLRHTAPAILGNLLRRLQPAAVLDVGANVGQYAREVREAGYGGVIVSFEAQPDLCKQLLADARGDRLWRIAPAAALGACAGSVELNLAGNSASSSVLDMLPAHLRAAPQSAYVGRQRVPLARLDELSVPLLPPDGQLFVKIDTQGYEREVLTGAAGVLPRVVAMQIELSLRPLYAGAPTMLEMLTLMSSLGFDPFHLVPAFDDAGSGRLLQAEGFFVRRELPE
jgi:FkbM family methyltransferase